jgi:hypothetical protein
MKRFLLISTFLILCCFKTNAAHIIGGEMRYDYLGPGIPGTNSYRITLILFRDRGGGGAALAFSYVVGVYNNDNGLKVIGPAANNNWQVNQQIPPGLAPVPIVFPTCIQSPPVLDYEYAVYTLIIDLPPTLAGYTIAYQTCCRINGIMNVGNSVGATYSCVIPGTNRVPTGDDSSPQFDLPVNVICQSPATFSLNFSAVDPNGDSLVYIMAVLQPMPLLMILRDHHMVRYCIIFLIPVLTHLVREQQLTRKQELSAGKRLLQVNMLFVFA